VAGLLPAIFHPNHGDIRRRPGSFILDPDFQDASIHEKQTGVQVDHFIDLFYGSIFHI
jgi:hypothetical protein